MASSFSVVRKYSTPSEIAGVDSEIDINLADRCGMRFPMLLGRTALAGIFVVNPAASFMHRRKARETIPTPVVQAKHS